MNGLYAIIDTETLIAAELDVVRFAAAVASARPAAMQLRDKRRDSRAHLALLRALVPLCADAGIPLFGNDRVDLALLAGCAGIHVGQQDLPPRAARELAVTAGRDDFRVGMSVHNETELQIAVDEQPDYIAFGPVFATQSKRNPDPVLGMHGLEALARRARQQCVVPRVAIGGIDVARAHAVAASGVEMAAVIGGLVDPAASDPYAAAAARVTALGAAWARGDGR